MASVLTPLWLIGFRALLLQRLIKKRLKPWRRSVSGGRRAVVIPRCLPPRIWIYWDSGEQAAPEIVQHCIARWRDLHPGWTLEVLDRERAGAAVDMSDMPEEMLPAHYADVLRVRLLKRFGGVWADATCLPVRPLDDWLPLLMQSGFFAFSNSGRNRALASWLLASEADGVVVARWEEKVSSYWVGRKEADTYFWLHHLFDWLILTDRDVRDCWDRTPKLHSDMAHVLKRALTGKWSEAEALARLSEAGPGTIPLHKLFWKDASLAQAEALLERVQGSSTPHPRGTGRS